MDFSEALTAVKQGKKVQRRYWRENPTGMGWTLELAFVSLADGRPVSPVLMCNRPDRAMETFSGANMDLMAEDWEIVD